MSSYLSRLAAFVDSMLGGARSAANPLAATAKYLQILLQHDDFRLPPGRPVSSRWPGKSAIPGC